MDEFRRDGVIRWYLDLEEELANLLAELPPVPANLDRYSPRLARLGVEACSIIDSLLRQSSPDPCSVDGSQIGRRDLNISHFAVLHAALGLSSLKSIFLVAQPRYLTPFSHWSGVTSLATYVPLPWWRDHALLKHDRIQNWEKGSLGLAIECMCALHQVISRLPEMAEAVVRYGWVGDSHWNPEFLIEFPRTRKGLGQGNVSMETRLFVTPLGPDPVPDNINDFKPALYGCSRRIAEFFGRWH